MGGGGAVGAGVATGEAVSGGAIAGEAAAVASGVALRFCSVCGIAWRVSTGEGAAVGVRTGAGVVTVVATVVRGDGDGDTDGTLPVSASPHAASSNAATPTMIVGASRESRSPIDLASGSCHHPQGFAGGYQDRIQRRQLRRAPEESSNRHRHSRGGAQASSSSLSRSSTSRCATAIGCWIVRPAAS